MQHRSMCAPVSVLGIVRAGIWLVCRVRASARGPGEERDLQRKRRPSWLSPLKRRIKNALHRQASCAMGLPKESKSSPVSGTGQSWREPRPLGNVASNRRLSGAVLASGDRSRAHSIGGSVTGKRAVSGVAHMGSPVPTLKLARSSRPSECGLSWTIGMNRRT